MSKARNIADIGSDDVISTSSTGIDVTGTVKITKGNNSGNALEIFNSGSSRSLQIDHNVDNSGTVDDIVRIRSNGTTVFEIENSGNVGIGASSPSYNLEITEAAVTGTNHEMLRLNTASGGLFGIRASDLSLSNPTWDFRTATNEAMSWTQNNVERMRIDSSGKVGIGTATFTGANAFMDDLVVYNATAGTGAGLSIISNATDGYSSIAFGDTADWDTGRVQYNHTDNSMAFHANSAERMRIGSSGNITLGPSGVSGVTAIPNYSAGAGLLYWNRTNTTAVSTALRFDNAGVAVGAIIYNNNSTAYNTSSDYRLKTDAQPMTGASARVQALNPVNFEWIADGTRVDGFLAHEAQSVVPECATGTKDAMKDEEYEVTPAVYEDVVIEAVLDDEGNELEAERTEQNLVTEAVMGTRSVPDYQGIDQSKLVPLLTAALQEALTKIDTLEAQNATFETRLTALEA
jgi:hypothetical protein